MVHCANLSLGKKLKALVHLDLWKSLSKQDCLTETSFELKQSRKIPKTCWQRISARWSDEIK